MGGLLYAADKERRGNAAGSACSGALNEGVGALEPHAVGLAGEGGGMGIHTVARSRGRYRSDGQRGKLSSALVRFFRSETHSCYAHVIEGVLQRAR